MTYKKEITGYILEFLKDSDYLNKILKFCLFMTLGASIVSLYSFFISPYDISLIFTIGIVWIIFIIVLFGDKLGEIINE